jgi:CDP-paratose 2-epimerase
MSTPPLLVTGGAGFIGSNLADRLAAGGHRVRIYDSLARAGVEENLAWLQECHGDRIEPVIADIRDEDALRRATADVAAVFHLAAQVAVTTSLADPAADFGVNLKGTFALLEALRARGEPVPLVFASTNKVYGDLADIPLSLKGDAWLPADDQVRRRGIGEDRPLDFHTPYGCSKGAADQYVVDYARSFGLPATVLRMSCIYGPRQRGTEDQGWVAHFLIRALAGETISIYGDGHQVRDILHVDDAVAAYIGAWQAIDRVAGQAFNLGGGPENAVSLTHVLAEAERLIGRPVRRELHPWRPGDQRYFVADAGRLRQALGLPAPRDWRSGLADLAGWLEANRRQPAAAGVTRLAPAQPRTRDPRRVVMTTDAVGGVWTYATDLAAGMAEAGIATRLVVLGPAPDAARAAQARAIPGLTLEVPDLALDWTARSAGELARVTEGLAALVRRDGADLVHLNHPALAAGLAVDVPVVAACHSCLATWWAAAGEGEMPEHFRWRIALQAAGLAAADRLVAPSRAFAAATEAAYGVRPEVVPNGRRSAPTPDLAPSRRKPQVVLAGRLWDRAKNLATFDAAAALADVPFRAAGALSGPAGDRVTARHAEALGTLDPPALSALLAASPVYASPALYEPFGLAVLEAAQAGCALVLSDIPTHREIWGEAAVFASPRDPAGFAAAVAALLADPQRLDALGAAAAAIASRHGLAPMVEGTRAVWRHALAANTAPAEDAA